VTSVLYDAGALIAADRGDARVLGMHRGWLRSGLSIYIPTAVLAQAWRSSRQARLAHLLSSCHDWPFDPSQARQVGELLAAAGTSDVIDGSVVIAAVRLRPAAVVTADRGDLSRLAKVARIALPIVDV
jgi:hypothetical protein